MRNKIIKKERNRKKYKNKNYLYFLYNKKKFFIFITFLNQI
jgi:hypothetical protein